MTYIKILQDGRPQISKDIAFCELLVESLPKPKKSFIDLFTEFDATIKTKFPQITREALSNVHGDWYEWLIAISAVNYTCNYSKANLCIPLPNVSQFDVSSLYKQDLLNLIQDLKLKVKSSTNVQLITSNPDFVILKRSLLKKLKIKLLKIDRVTCENLSYIDNVYSQFISQCEFEDILGYVSVKTSLRPDRRLQIPHEGSLIKALYTHLQTRQWITDPKGIKYYAISRKLTQPDRNALKTVATHSLTTVFTKPQPAVDEVFEINSLESTKDVWDCILI